MESTQLVNFKAVVVLLLAQISAKANDTKRPILTCEVKTLYSLILARCNFLDVSNSAKGIQLWTKRKETNALINTEAMNAHSILWRLFFFSSIR